MSLVKPATNTVMTKITLSFTNWCTTLSHAWLKTMATVRIARSTSTEAAQALTRIWRPVSGPVKDLLEPTSLGLPSSSMSLEVYSFLLRSSCSLASCSPTGADVALWWCESIVKQRGKSEKRKSLVQVLEDDQRAKPKTRVKEDFLPKWKKCQVSAN